MHEQLQQLNREIDDLTGKVETAQDNWLKAQDARQEAKLERVYEDLKKKEELLNARIAKLEEKLPSSGEHIVQTAFAEAALATVGTSAQKRLSDSWLEHHRLCCCNESAVSAITHIPAQHCKYWVSLRAECTPCIALSGLMRVPLAAGAEAQGEVPEGKDGG